MPCATNLDPYLARVPLVFLIFVSLIICPVAHAQSETSDDESDNVPDVIVVEGQVLRGQNFSPAKPDLVLTESDIAAYGVSSIGELLSAIAEESGSNRGRGNEPPVVLLNGRRISGFREIGRYPVEAVARVEVLAEEVSLSYGFPANQRVINFILKENITIFALEAETKTPEAGGSTQLDGSAQRLFINGDTRFSLDAAIKDRPPIFESERISNQSRSTPTGRSIIGDLQEASLGASYSQSVLGNSIATVTASYEKIIDQSLLDEAGVTKDQITSDFNLGFSVNGPLAPTSWTLSGEFSKRDINISTKIDSPNFQFPLQDVEYSTRTALLNGVLNFRPIELSAGPLALTLSGSLKREVQTPTRLDGTQSQASESKRDAARFAVNADGPFTAPFGAMGDIILNGNISHEYLSDVGDLHSYGSGIAWEMSRYFQWDVSFSFEDGAPSLSDLYKPQLLIQNTRFFDSMTGEDVLVETLTGGNSDLLLDERDVQKIGFQWSPKGDDTFRIRSDYTYSKIENETREFSFLTPGIERAFPDRFVRDEAGALIALDQRPIVSSRTEQKNIRTNISWSKPIRAKRKRAKGPKPTKRLRSGRPGRLRISLTHDWALEDALTLSDFGPRLDFLNGAASSTLGGTPEHSIDLTAYRWNEGFGSFFSLKHRSGTQANTDSRILRFSDRTLINARMTYEFNYSGSLVARWPMLEETRLLIGVENLLNDPIDIVDDKGTTPITLQPELLDPFGRSFRVEIRKRF